MGKYFFYYGTKLIIIGKASIYYQFIIVNIIALTNKFTRKQGGASG